MGKDGNKLGCTRGEPSDKPSNPPEVLPEEGKNKGKLVRIGSRFFSKDVSTTKRFNFGIEVGRSETGVRVKDYILGLRKVELSLELLLRLVETAILT